MYELPTLVEKQHGVGLTPISVQLLGDNVRVTPSSFIVFV